MTETPLHPPVSPYANRAHRQNCGCQVHRQRAIKDGVEYVGQVDAEAGIVVLLSADPVIRVDRVSEGAQA